MTVKLIVRNKIGEYVLEGRMDSNNSDEVKQAILDSCEPFEKIILNFERLQYISSSGLRVLKILHQYAEQKDVELVLTNVSAFVLEVLEMTGFAQILDIE